MPHKSKRHFLALIASALLLAACGGSDRNDLHSKDLYGAYEVVTEGMSLTQLKTVIGAEPAGSRADGDEITIYTWVAEEGSYLETRLHVNVRAGYGVVGKTVLGPNGSKTASYL
jgi:ABC-type glycerol-3-phosphate transport system substrate-binding protein